jgi:hypothetical protein
MRPVNRRATRPFLDRNTIVESLRWHTLEKPAAVVDAETSSYRRPPGSGTADSAGSAVPARGSWRHLRFTR